MYDDFRNHQDIGHFIGALDIEGFIPFEEFILRVDQVIRVIKAVKPACGFTEVCLPGEFEHRNRVYRIKQGIPMEKKVYDELSELGARHGIRLQ